jgi:outer membrane protein TolC
MKKFSLWSMTIWLAAGIAPSLLAQAPPSATATLTLPEAVQLALKNNPTVQATDAYAEAVRHGITIAQSGRYPRIDFSEGVTRGNNPVYVFGSLLTQGQFTAANFVLPSLNYPAPLDNFRTQFTAAMPLWDAGQTSRRVRDARLNSQGAAQATERSRQEVIFAVVQAYLNGLLARESVRVAEAASEMSKADLARAQARGEQGLAVPSDLLSAQVQLAQAQEDLLRAKNAVALADSALNVAMGQAEDAPVSLASRWSDVRGGSARRAPASRAHHAARLPPGPDRRAARRERAKHGPCRVSAQAEYLRLMGAGQSDLRRARQRQLDARRHAELQPF